MSGFWVLTIFPLVNTRHKPRIIVMVPRVVINELMRNRVTMTPLMIPRTRPEQRVRSTDTNMLFVALSRVTKSICAHMYCEDTLRSNSPQMINIVIPHATTP